ncbi:TIGR01777 family oxidoreductase [Mesobacillus harenae]|uniref:TIGR01777 family oxidoreductase n=1 Tax=Mesobacillus harenae TaxID=2213203 RepID=UPI0015808F56|nr:TIGR01777 family oxidoreductase [Mesobacillus harenae]
MKIAITGGTGLVGKSLASSLIESGNEVIILTRNDQQTNHQSLKFIKWLHEDASPENELEGTDVFINLAGTTINTRWTDSAKSDILSSRITATNEVLRIIGLLSKRPKLLINASAVGFYGVSEKVLFTEAQPEPGSDFLAETVMKWEQEALRAENMGLRTVLCRFGIILDKEEGALPKMVMPYRLFAGGRIGSGRQWVSWIHLDDAVKAIHFVIGNENLKGAVNFTAPEPVRMDEFGKTIADVVNRPHWIPVPTTALKAILGEMSFLILYGQQAVPSKLTEQGFQFRYPTLKPALKQIYS